MTLAEALDSLPLTALDRLAAPPASGADPVSASTRQAPKPPTLLAVARQALTDAHALSAEVGRFRAMLDAAIADLSLGPRDPEDLQRGMESLLTWERDLADRTDPLRHTLAGRLASRAGPRGPAEGVLRRVDDVVLEAVTLLLESLRDGRLRLASLQAEAIDADAAPSPVFDTADEALAWLKARAAE